MTGSITGSTSRNETIIRLWRRFLRTMTQSPDPAGLFIFLEYLDLLPSSPLEVGYHAYFMKLSKGRVRL